MLRRAENVNFSHRRGFWTGNGPAVISIGRKSYELRKISRNEFREHHEQQLGYPKLVARISDRRYWHFQNRFYWENDGLNADEVYAVITTREQRKRQQIDRAQAMVAMGSVPRGTARRGKIPDDVKQYIWTRDSGQCQSCWSTEELQYDHIIPVSKGGSSSVENLQILCGPCNRSKAAGLTTRR